MSKTYKSIKAVIFDMDGVIADTQYLHDQANSEILASYGIKIPPEEITSKWAGVPQRKVFGDIFKEHHVKVDLNKAMADKWALVMKRADKIEEIPGAINFINGLSNKNLSLAVASSCSRQFIEHTLSHLKIANLFKAVVDGEETKKGKPSPDIFLKAAEKLNINPQNCLVIEDAPTGVKAAKAAGMKCIAITTTHKRKELKNADKIISSFNELSIRNL